MKRRTLQQLIDLSRRQRDEAAAESAGAERDARAAGQTLESLTVYRRELERRGAAAAGTGMDPRLLVCRRQFADRLEQAIDAQADRRQVLDDAARERHQQLVERQKRLLAYEQLLNRRDHEARRTTLRRDQQHTDEQAGRLHTTRTTRMDSDE